MHTREEKLAAFGRLLDVMDELREKCPWDRKQTNESLRPNTIEETYELADAIIRILDLAGKHNINLSGIIEADSKLSKDKRFTENIRTIEKYLCHDGFSLDEKLNYAKQEICTFAELLGIDIITHINLKMM